MTKRNARKSQRGAVFVEAIIVISFFTLCFLGVVYFRELYLGKLHVQRVARASAMAHAMGACRVDPKAGLEADLPANPPKPAEQKTDPGHPPDFGNPTGEAKDALDSFDRSKGGAPLDEVTEITVTTSAEAITNKGKPSQKGFRSEVGSTSSVTCTDPVSDESFEQLFPKIGDIFGTFF